MADLIRQRLDQWEDPDRVHIFFSAHGVPLSYVKEAGDPYQREIEDCAKRVIKTLDRPNAYTLAYQSRVGSMEWLRPYTDDAIQALGAKGVKDLLVVPISFVSEHIETLQEIDIECKELAKEAGITHFQRVPALNTHPRFMEDLADLVEESLDAPSLTLEEVIHPPKRVKIYPQERWEWGLTNFAEVWNGRLAMLGFIALLIELISGQGPLHFVGLL
jgi:ferrochelatase